MKNKCLPCSEPRALSRGHNITMLKCYNAVRGFTLIEMMVSISIIVVLVVSAIGIYMYTIGPQQKIIATADLQADGQLILNMIAKDIRANQVDYAEYGCGIAERIGYLYLTDGANLIRYICCNESEKLCSTDDQGALKRCEGGSCLPATDNLCDPDDPNFSTYQQVSMTDVKVNRLNFYVLPDCNPFDATDPSFRHPQVTVVLELKSYKERVGERTVRLQQTIPQRYQEKRYY